MLPHLQSVGCERYTAARRLLHFDDYGLLMLLVLLSMFNPTLGSLRSLQTACDFQEFRDRLVIRRRSSLGRAMAGGFSVSRWGVLSGGFHLFWRQITRESPDSSTTGVPIQAET